MRPSDRSCSVAYPLASTVVSREGTASMGIDSCHRTCESYVHAYSKPWLSASRISSSQRLYGGSGRTVTPKVKLTRMSLLRQDRGREDRLRGPELRRARGGARRRCAHRAAALRQVREHADR